MLGRRKLELVGCGVAGALVWTLFVVGRTGDDGVPVGFWVAMVGLVAALALVVEGNAVAAAFAGPAVLAMWTTPRGDNDGLWTLVELLLAVAAVIVAVARPLVRQRWSPHPWLLGFVVLAGAVGTVQLIVVRRADPYPGLERIVADFSAPASFDAEGVHRGGDPLCNRVCGAFVEARFTTAGSPEEACEALGTALGEWRRAERTETVLGPEYGGYEVCRWDIEDGSAVVEDDADGVVIRVTVEESAGGRAGVRA